MSYKLSHLAPCFYREGIYPLFLARVDEDAVLSDSAHSGGAAADAVVPVALHRSWVRLNSEALVRWSSEIQQDLIWWWTHKRLKLVSSLGRGFSPVDLWSDSSYVGWALVSTLFEVPSGPEPIGVSAVSVKVGGVPHPVRNHTFSPLLALFFSFPRSQRS